MSPRRAALTLVELLVSIGLGMALIAMAYSALVRVKASAARAAARVELHSSAAAYRALLERDLGNLAPALAFFARSVPQADAGAGQRTDTLELVFMRTAAPLASQWSSDSGEQAKSEFQWVRWRFVRAWHQVDGAWTVASSRLLRSASSPARTWTTGGTATRVLAAPSPLFDPAPGWPKWTSYVDARYARQWLNIPRPLRDASQGIESLENNRYGMDSSYIDPASTRLDRGDTGFGDVGDLTDLDNTEQLVSDRVRDLAIGWVDAGGQSVELTSADPADQRVDGLYLDGVGPPGGRPLATLARRPRVVRIAFALRDPKADLAQDFSFSIATPGLQPQIGE